MPLYGRVLEMMSLLLEMMSLLVVEKNSLKVMSHRVMV